MDRLAEMEQELAGVFSALQPVVDECARLVEQAGEEAADTLRRARAEAALAVAGAGERASEEASEEARRESGRLERQAEQILGSARAEAERIRSVLPVRLEALRDRIVDYILALPGGETR